MSSDILNKTQFSELQRLKEEAAASVRKSNPELVSKVAGMSLSDGGFEKVLELLDSLFDTYQKAAQDMPEEFSLNISPETLSNVDATATFYLWADNYRPRRGWTLSAKKTGIEF